LEKKGLVIFVVLGRLGRNLAISKLAPICSIEEISKVYAFCEFEGIEFNDKLCYITLPRFILSIKPIFLSRIFKWFYEPFLLFWYTIKYHPDYINGVYLLPKGLYSFIVSWVSKTNCIISIIGGKEEVESGMRVPKIWKGINLFVLEHCWAITCKGNKDINYLVKEGIKERKIFVFNGGIDVKRFSSSISYREIDLIFAGKFDYNKGPFRVLEMIRKLVSEIKNIKCILLGEGKLRKSFENEIIKFNLQSNIQCLGHVENPESYFQQAKLFVLPSTNEGLSTSMLESMSCGCVPVVSNVGNTSEAVIHGINGILIHSYDDINDYVSNILILLNDREKWSDYSKKAEMTISDKYNYNVQGQLYKRILIKTI
jgi:glycosyltransferase involved in cell wall biosynthesis